MSKRKDRRSRLAKEYQQSVLGASLPVRQELNRQEKALTKGKDPLYRYLSALGASDATGAVAADYDAIRNAVTSDLGKVDVSSGAAADIAGVLGGAIGADPTVTANLVAGAAVNPNLDAATRAALVADASVNISMAKAGALKEERTGMREARMGAAQRDIDLASERRNLALQRLTLKGKALEATSPFATRAAVREEQTAGLAYADAVQSFKKKYGRLPTRKELGNIQDSQFNPGGNTFVSPGEKR